MSQSIRSQINTPVLHSKHVAFESLKTTSVDRVSGLLSALTIFALIAVVSLGTVFILSLFQSNQVEAKDTFFLGGSSDFQHITDDVRLVAYEVAAPETSEVAQLEEPSLESSLDGIPASLITSSDWREASSEIESSLLHQKPVGDQRVQGPIGTDIVPRHQRWELTFSARDAKSYATQLDFFQIELGVAGGGIVGVDYVKNLRGPLITRSGNGELEKRLYFANQHEGPLANFERSFVHQAGLKSSNRIVLKMLPPELESVLESRELDFAKEKRGPDVLVQHVAKTTFRCQPMQENRYQWVIVDQRYRRSTSNERF